MARKQHPNNRKKDESESKKPRGTDQGRRESPRSHEEAPGRNPAPTRPAGDEPSRGRRERDTDEPEVDIEPDRNQPR